MFLRIKASRVLGVLVGGLMLFGASAPASAQGIGVGIKGGLVFSKFTTDVLKPDSRVGWQAGLFFGGGRESVIGVQTELNWLRKETDYHLAGTASGNVTLDYLQVPVLLRLNAATQSKNGFALYVMGGPSFEGKIHASVTGFGNPSISATDFQNFDVGLMFGGGVELSRFIIEGRYSKGLLEVDKNFQAITDIRINHFAALIGIRFN
jgi:outer membrane protein with beta-barrel domain